jgi:Bacterial protein of unknown function (DUF839)
VLRRLCSATLPAPSALYNADTGKGYDGRIFMNGEEVPGTEGRALGHLLDGTSYELPALGKASWENQVANPGTGDKTVVVGLDDSSPGQVYVYVGEKRDTGNAVERAGLTGGTLYGIKVDGFPREDMAPPDIEFPRAFTGHSFGDVSSLTGMQLNAASNTAGVTRFERPEDGVWSATDPHDFYFVTTVGGSKLWRLRFVDPADPAAGGTISVLLAGGRNSDADGPYRNLDNLTSTDRDQLVIQEDPGPSGDLAAVWQYDIETGALEKVAEADAERFGIPTAPFTREEESSGVIDASDILGEGWYLLDVMAHYPNPDLELVQGGQLLAMHIPPGRPIG